MTFDDLQVLLDYHYWARDRLLGAVDTLSAEEFRRDLKNSFPSVRETLLHLLYAEWVWHARWIGQSPTQKPSDDRLQTLADIRAEWTRLEGAVRGFFAGLEPEQLWASFDYTMMNGVSYRSVYADTLQHLVNHGSFHRGQVVTLLRQLGHPAPASLDLISYYREGGGGR